MAQPKAALPSMPMEEALKMRDSRVRAPQAKKRKTSDSKFMVSAVALVSFSLIIVLLEMFLVGGAHVQGLQKDAETEAVVTINK